MPGTIPTLYSLRDNPRKPIPASQNRREPATARPHRWELADSRSLGSLAGSPAKVSRYPTDFLLPSSPNTALNT